MFYILGLLTSEPHKHWVNNWKIISDYLLFGICKQFKTF